MLRMNIEEQEELLMCGRSGLGALLSTTFAAQGCNVAINYFNRVEPAQAVAAACEKLGVKAVIIKAVRDPSIRCNQA